MHIESLGVADVVAPPHAVDQRLPGKHSTGVGQQQVQQLELLQRQRDIAAVDRDAVLVGIERDVADRQRAGRQVGRAGGVGWRATQHRAHPCDDLAHPVRLGDVVVGADLEADDGVDLGAFRGDHDDGHMAALAQLTTDVDAAEARQHHVEQDDVGLHLVEPLHRLEPVA